MLVRKWNLLNFVICMRVWMRKGKRKICIKWAEYTYFYRLLCQIIHSFKHFIIILCWIVDMLENVNIFTRISIFFAGFALSNMRQYDRVRSLFLFFYFFLMFYNVLHKSRTWQWMAVVSKCCIIFHFYGIECVWCCHLFTFNFFLSTLFLW